jgi:hypothetical protein
MKRICYCYYLKPVYAESTPDSNAKYARDHPKVLMDEGEITNGAMPNHLIPLKF